VSSEDWRVLLRGRGGTFAGDAVARLHRAMQLGHDVAPGLIAGCSITELEGTRYSTPVSSDHLAASLDEAQYEAGRGPCMAAARDHQVHHLADLRTDGQFDHFSSAAVAHGVLSSLSLPLDGTYRPAALNFYATSPGVFTGHRERRIAGLLARAIAARMLQSATGSRTGSSLRVLPPEAQARAAVVVRAQTLLAEEFGSPEQAFCALALRSREQVRSIFDIARDVLDAAESPS
jgi:hypothetical protein